MSLLPELRPVAGMTAAPTLTAINGRIEIKTAGEPDRTIPPGIVASIARYDTVVEMRRGFTVRRMHRVGWRLLDANGNAVAWLVNSDRPAYADDAVQRFAHGARLQVVDSGRLSREFLLGNSGDRIGPGTSGVTSLVAPPYQWALTLVVLGGMALGVAPALRDDLSKSALPLAAAGGFFGMLVAAFLSPRIGAIQHIWREQRHRRRASAQVLRSQARTPGLVIAVSDGRVGVSDYLQSWAGPVEATTFVPYDVTGSGRRDEVGMIVRWKGAGYVDIADRFDPNEVVAFAAMHRIATAPAHLGQLPPEPKPTASARPEFVNRLRKFSWLAPVFWLFAVAGPVLAVLGLIGVLPLPIGACVGMLGFAVLVAGGYLVAKYRFSDSLVHPERG